jgi:hypothetical protein
LSNNFDALTPSTLLKSRRVFWLGSLVLPGLQWPDGADRHVVCGFSKRPDTPAEA